MNRASQGLRVRVAWHNSRLAPAGTRGMSMKILTILMVLGAWYVTLCRRDGQAPVPRGTGYPRGRLRTTSAQLPPARRCHGPVSNRDEDRRGVQSKDVATTGFDDPQLAGRGKDGHDRTEFIGARFRYVIMPKVLHGDLRRWRDDGRCARRSVRSLRIRKNGFEYVMSVMYASYAMDPTPFKAKTDEHDAWEIVEYQHQDRSTSCPDFSLVGRRRAPSSAFTYGGGVRPGHRVRRHSPSAGVIQGSADNLNDPYRTCRALPTRQAQARDGRAPSIADGQRPLRRLHRAELGQRGSKPILFPCGCRCRPAFRFKPSQRVHGQRVDIGLEHSERPVLRPGPQLRVALIA